MCVVSDWVALTAQAQWDAEHGAAGALDDSLALYRRLEITPRDRLDDPERIAIETRLTR
jgi:hypothetical protein